MRALPVLCCAAQVVIVTPSEKETIGSYAGARDTLAGMAVGASSSSYVRRVTLVHRNLVVLETNTILARCTKGGIAFRLPLPLPYCVRVDSPSLVKQSGGGIYRLVLLPRLRKYPTTRSTDGHGAALDTTLVCVDRRPAGQVKVRTNWWLSSPPTDDVPVVTARMKPRPHLDLAALRGTNLDGFSDPGPSYSVCW